jgi:hypothetical protein
MLMVHLAGVSSLLLATQLLHLLLHAQLPAGSEVNIALGKASQAGAKPSLLAGQLPLLLRLRELLLHFRNCYMTADRQLLLPFRQSIHLEQLLSRIKPQGRTQTISSPVFTPSCCCHCP